MGIWRNGILAPALLLPAHPVLDHRPCPHGRRGDSAPTLTHGAQRRSGSRMALPTASYPAPTSPVTPTPRTSEAGDPLAAGGAADRPWASSPVPNRAGTPSPESSGTAFSGLQREARRRSAWVVVSPRVAGETADRNGNRRPRRSWGLGMDAGRGSLSLAACFLSNWLTRPALGWLPQRGPFA